MIVLVVVAVLVMAALWVSAGFTMHDVSQTDETAAGPWGVMLVEKPEKRRLSAQARRWQTSLTRAESDAIRWGELVTYIDRLEATIDPGAGALVDDRPEQVDRRYLQARITRLESLLDSPPTQHGATQHGATQHGATQHGATQHGATQHGATQREGPDHV